MCESMKQLNAAVEKSNDETPSAGIPPPPALLPHSDAKPVQAPMPAGPAGGDENDAQASNMRLPMRGAGPSLGELVKSRPTLKKVKKRGKPKVRKTRGARAMLAPADLLKQKGALKKPKKITKPRPSDADDGNWWSKIRPKIRALRESVGERCSYSDDEDFE